MKNKITCLLAGVALFGATANADIVLADGLTAYGYIDITAQDLEGEDRTSDLSEYELGLSYTPAESQWSAVAELSYTGGGDSAFETVTVTYQYSDALSFTAGNILSYQGLESFDAPNNNFISYAGSPTVANGVLYSAGYAEGVSADYSAGDITLGVWADVTADTSYEYYAAYSGIENLTLSVAIADNSDDSETTNIMAQYDLGDFALSFENVDSDGFATDLDVDVFAVAYGMGDTTVAVRLTDGEIGGNDYEKTSIAAFHALSDNVAAGIEYSDGELGAVESKGFGVELLYVF